MYPIIHCPNPYCVILHNKCYNRSVLCLLHQCLLRWLSPRAFVICLSSNLWGVTSHWAGLLSHHKLNFYFIQKMIAQASYCTQACLLAI